MSYDALENLTSRASALVRQFGLDAKGHGLSDDRAAIRLIRCHQLVKASGGVGTGI